jgi:hypothetical protein
LLALQARRVERLRALSAEQLLLRLRACSCQVVAGVAVMQPLVQVLLVGHPQRASLRISRHRQAALLAWLVSRRVTARQASIYSMVDSCSLAAAVADRVFRWLQFPQAVTVVLVATDVAVAVVEVQSQQQRKQV